MRAYPGYFITLEGGEGCGKTYQIPFIVEWLRQSGLSVYPTREPGGTDISEQIREILHSINNTEMHPRTETLLYQVARAQIVEQIIRPRLELGQVVISDRFSDSTIAYQGFGHRQNREEISSLIRYATGSLTPDMTILIDLDPEIGVERKHKGNSEFNRMDSLQRDFYERVRSGYFEIARADPSRWVVIDGNQKPEAVFADLSREIENKLIFNGFLEGNKGGPER